jgi:hypothetical protein
MYADHFTQKAKPVGAAHGDVILIRVDELPNQELKQKEDRCVAYGEVTGHHHKVFGNNVDVFESPTQDDICFVVAEEEFSIKHQEHGTITFEPGTYKVVRQVEFDESEYRRVMD